MKPLTRSEKRAEWTSRALCLGCDIYYWFDDTEGHFETAKQVCAQCPVKDECLADAQYVEDGRSHTGCYGVYGGLTPVERWRIRNNLPEETEEEREQRLTVLREQLHHYQEMWRTRPPTVEEIEDAHHLTASLREGESCKQQLHDVTYDSLSPVVTETFKGWSLYFKCLPCYRIARNKSSHTHYHKKQQKKKEEAGR